MTLQTWTMVTLTWCWCLKLRNGFLDLGFGRLPRNLDIKMLDKGLEHDFGNQHLILVTFENTLTTRKKEHVNTDPHQYAFRTNGSTEDTISTAQHSVFTHNEVKTTANQNFKQSHPFNTLGLSDTLCHWILINVDEINNPTIGLWWSKLFSSHTNVLNMTLETQKCDLKGWCLDRDFLNSEMNFLTWVLVACLRIWTSKCKLRKLNMILSIQTWILVPKTTL